MLLNIVSRQEREMVEEDKRGPVRACSLSPLKFKMGVRDKSPTPIYSPLILIPITATIRTQQILEVITVLLNIVSCQERGEVAEDKRDRFEPRSLTFKVQNRSKG